MLKKLTYTVFALVLLAACGGDFTEMDVGSLDGSWIAQNGAELYINGMGYTRTAVNGDVQTGTLAAVDGYITFSRIGHSPETREYTLNFPQLKIGNITYYYNSLSEPIDIAGRWFAYSGLNAALIFYPGKRIRDENNKEIFTREGEFILYGYFRGKYTISNRNLPDSSILVLTTSHIHGKEIWSYMYAYEDVPLDIQELFDHSVLAIPSTFEGLEDWWFTLDEVRDFFEAAADRTTDIVKKDEVNARLEEFIGDYMVEGVYSYTVVYDPDIPNYEHIDMTGVPNKLTLVQDGDVERFLKALPLP
jgi:hypothetical protein